jgi:hypothetical protein
MRKTKRFDCVAMKDAIQRELTKEYEGLTLAERQALMQRKILADPILGPWWRKAKPNPSMPAIVAETPAGYQVKRTGRGERK